MADKSPLPIWIDGFSSFELGINSGVAPLLLAKNQLSFAINATVRGNFVTHRPCFRKIALTFDTSASQAIFESQGLWQGGCFFKSEYGTEAMVVSIGGHLFQVRPGTGATADVTDVSIPGDLNNSGLAIAWLWQAERWVIVQDGQDIPIFYDGQTSRRSNGPQTQLGQVAIGNDFTVPAIGATINITLAAPYTGPINQTIFIDNAFYQVNSSGTGFGITLKNLTEPAGGTAAIGESLLIPSSFVGITSTSTTINAGGGFFIFATSIPAVPLGPVSFHKPGTGITYTTLTGFNTGAPPSLNLLTAAGSGTVGDVFPPNTAVYQGYFSSIGTAGVLQSGFVIPAVGATVNTFITTPYNGALGQKVVINGGVYEITATNNTPAVSNVISVTNINDTLAGNRGPATPTTPGILYTIPEILIGRMGVYGLGRNWYSLADGRSYRATDIVGSSSGSPALQNRDAVLHETENTFLTNGNFVIPGNIGDIRSMTFTATLDSSLGQGPLQIGTPNTIFSNNAPVDSSLWQTMENPIQTQSLKGTGPLNQYGTILVNSDTLFRSAIGWGSLILARREFSTWGNTPISREVQRVVNQDDSALLGFGSAVQFSNRFLATSKPVQSVAGVFHQGSVSLNFEPISGIGQKAQSVWDGLWTGINTLLWITGAFQSVPRAFAFSYNFISNKIELYELLEDGVAIADNNGIEDIPITWTIETAMLFKDQKSKAEFDLCKIIDGELFVAEVANTVRFEVFYRSQFDPCWHPWTDFTICATQDEPLARQQNRISLGLGKPPTDSCDPSNNRPYYVGETFQFRLKITGHCKFYGMRVKAAYEADPYFKPAMCGEQECKLVQCVVESDYGTYLLQDRPIPVVSVVFNQQTTVVHQCPFGTELTFTGSLPSWLILDGATNSLTAKSGVFTGATQEAANVAAQNAINDFITAALAAGTLTCENPTPPLSIILVNAETTGWGADAAIAFVEVAGVFYGLGGTFFYSSTDGVNWTSMGAHGIATPQSLAFGVGVFAAVGQGPNRMWSSPDGITWTAHAYAGAAGMEGVVFGLGQFVAGGGAAGTGLTSPDGLVWTPQTIGGGTNHVRSMAFGVGLYVGAGQDGVAGTIYSSPDGVLWTLRVSSGATSNFKSVSFSNSLFVAVGNSGRIYTSPDGLVWTLQAQIVDGTLVASGGGAGIYVICTFGGDVYTSPDGIVWTFLKTEPSTRIAAQQGVGYYSTANVIDIGYFP